MLDRRTVVAVLTCAVLVSACAQPAPQRSRPGEVRGIIAWRMRAPVPAGALAQVTLVEVRGKVSESVPLAEETLPVNAPTPVAFVLPYPGGRIDPDRHYALRARVVDADGRVSWATPRPIPVLTHGRPNEAEVVLSPVPGPGQPAPPATRCFECTGLAFTARHDPRGLFLFMPSETVLLAESPSASGARYSDGRTTFWSKGEQAVLEAGGRTYGDCRNNRVRAVWEDAKLNGVDFRAAGNEPGWYLEVYDKGAPERIDVVVDYGRDYYTFPEVRRDRPSPTLTRYTALIGALRLEVALEPSPCSDTMSGEAFDTRVTVRLGHRTLTGCGRALH